MAKLRYLVLLVALVPAMTLAAFNTVTHTSGTQAYLTGTSKNYTVNDSTRVAEYTVNASTIDFSVSSGSIISLTSSDKSNFTYSATTCGDVSITCGANSSVLFIQCGPTASAHTITVTPSGTCSDTGVSSPPSGGSPGGGSSYVAPTPAPTPVPATIDLKYCPPTLVAGDLVMVNDKSSTAVWILDAGLKRIYFPNESVYQTWYATTAGKADWSMIKKVAPSCLETVLVPAAAPFGVNYFPGSTVLKLEGGTKYFVTEAGNKKSEITEVAAAELFGSTWKSRVKTYSQFFSTWAATDGVKIETARLVDGSLVKKTGGDVYQVVDSKLNKVDGTLTGAAAKSVRTVSDTLFATGEVLTTTVTPASLKLK